jgi:hypothetical protein
MISLQKCFVDMKKRFGKAKLALLFLSALLLAIIVAPVAKAAGQSISLDPSEGPSGKVVMAYVHGFPEPSVSITFGTLSLGEATTLGGTAHVLIIVPPVPPGTYTVTASGSSGVATATFTVTEGPPPASSETPTETPSGTPIELSPTNTPVAVKTGFWSPLVIAAISAVIVCAIFVPVVYVKRGKQKTSQYEETSNYEPRLPVPSKKPYVPSKINQPTFNSQLPPFTKICRHCKRIVRDDQNVCPYCFKRLK